MAPRANVDRGLPDERARESRRARLIVGGVLVLVAAFVATELLADRELDREVRDLTERMEAHIGVDPGRWSEEIALDLRSHPDDPKGTMAAAELREVAGADASLFSVEAIGQGDDVMAVFRATSWWRDRCATLWVLGGFVSWNDSACP